MATRITIPLFVDAVLIDDPAHMRELEAHSSIQRSLAPGGGLVNWLVRRRINAVLAVDGRRLPAFLDRSDAQRQQDQQRLEGQLTRQAGDLRRFEGEIARLAEYVAGAPLEGQLGPLVQQLVGRMFDPGYRASPETYKAARDVERGWTILGDLAVSRWLLWHSARNNPHCIHATALAMHNVVGTLRNMRTLAREAGARRLDPDYAVSRCLVAPRVLLRSCHSAATFLFLAEALRRGSLVIYRLRTMHARSADEGLAFARSEWNQCPAHALLHVLLREVWNRVATGELVSQQISVKRRAWRPGLVARILIAIFRPLNRWVRWHWLRGPFKYLGIANLIAVRETLRRDNLHDPTPPAAFANPGTPWRACYVGSRSPDGAFNDLDAPAMGRAGARFGRNVPLAAVRRGDERDLYDPNPCEVSDRLMTRNAFKPATSLNLLAAAWLQFQVHDWMSHDLEPVPGMHLERKRTDTWPDDRMDVRLTRREPAQFPDDDPLLPVYANTVTHWWDASQIYGSSREVQMNLRTGDGSGTLKIQPDGLLPRNEKTGFDLVGAGENWWLGLSLMHTLFVREHNAICARLRAEYPRWSDERLFQTARLINAALIAKIQTLEWTPAILGHPVVISGMHGNWWGLLGECVRRRWGRIFEREEWSGIPGSPTDHHSAAYSITEEFVAVYRMHPLMPDEFAFYSAGGGGVMHKAELLEVMFQGARKLVEQIAMADLLYSFGIAHPGELTLYNYPQALREFVPPDKIRIDLAAMDIFRDRERGVPRYNEFRRLLGLPVASFKELTDGQKVRDVYGGRLDKVDLMTGLFAEGGRPHGFGFSDTAFRVFILMASRRLKSDRFFTRDYTPAVYTQAGMDWINDSDMRRVLARHHPQLTPVLQNVRNVFAPWRAN